MPGVISNEYGKISMSDDIIATIAGYAAVENYGILGMSSKTAGESLWHLIGGDNQKRGVKVTPVNDLSEIDIDMHVTLSYGASLPAVARNVIQNVKYRVSEMTGLTVRNVNIHVDAIQV